MDSGLYSGVAAMRAGEKRLESITSNLANVSTVAFKRRAAFTLAVPVGRDGSTTQVASAQGVDLTNGAIEATGNALDLALEGDGFFQIETTDGPAYTRDGRFHVDDRGALVDLDGRAVAFDSGSPLLDPTGDSISVDPSGVVTQGARRIGRLKLVDFDARERLVEDASGALRAPAALAEKPADARVHAGAVERSNVNALEELVGLVVAQRGFDSASTVLEKIDQTYRRLNQPR